MTDGSNVAGFIDTAIAIVIIGLIFLSSYLYGIVTSCKDALVAKTKLADTKNIYIDELNQKNEISKQLIEKQRFQIELMGKTIESLEELCEGSKVKLKIMESEKLELENKISNSKVQKKDYINLKKIRRIK